MGIKLRLRDDWPHIEFVHEIDLQPTVSNSFIYISQL